MRGAFPTVRDPLALHANQGSCVWPACFWKFYRSGCQPTNFPRTQRRDILWLRCQELGICKSLCYRIHKSFRQRHILSAQVQICFGGNRGEGRCCHRHVSSPYDGLSPCGITVTVHSITLSVQRRHGDDARSLVHCHRNPGTEAPWQDGIRD